MNELNEEQLKVAHHVLHSRKNTFITGSAGTGKSFLLKCIVKQFNKKLKPTEIAVCAMTGLAAIGIEGKTLHSFSGMGHDLSKDVREVPYIYRRWMKTKVLIIDEVSMLTREFLEKIAPLIQKFNIQLVAFGDLLQLPPVNVNGELKDQPCFTSPAWDELKLSGEGTFIMKEIVRQKDEAFIKVLNEIRIGEISSKSEEFLRKISEKTRPSDTKLTKLYALNRSVDSENKKKLSMLAGNEIILRCLDKTSAGRPPVSMIQMIDRQAPREIVIKVGARVMLTRNRPGSILVNGSLGQVISIDGNNNPIIQFDCFPAGNPMKIEQIEYEVKFKGMKYVRMQHPLKLAWSLTIHKSQGMTLDNVLASVKGAFECGQIYTVLSRVRSPDGLYIDDVETIVQKNKINNLAKQYYVEHGGV